MGVQEKSLFKRKRDRHRRKQKETKLINYLRRELGSCTTHGLPYIVNTEIHWLERLFWTVNFMLCWAFIIILLLALFTRFLDSPTVVSVEMDYFNWNVSYPAITLCPVFKLDDDKWEALINDTYKKTGKHLPEFIWSISSLTLENLENIDLENFDPVIDPRDFGKIANAVFRKFDTNSLTTNTNWSVSINAAMTENGMCHVINSNVAAFHEPSKWDDHSTYTKTNIEVSAHEQNFYVQIIDYAEDYKIYIHSPDEMIHASSTAYGHFKAGFVFLGSRVWSTRTSESLRSVPIRFRRCRFIEEPISERFPVYSYNICLLECRIAMIKRLCGCVPHFYRSLYNEKVCNFKQLACVLKYQKEIMSLSTSEETLKQFQNARELPTSSKDCNCLNTCESDIYMKDRESSVQQPFYMLKVGVTTFPRIRIVRNVIFSAYDLFLRSGGVINLCIGASIISIMELLVIPMNWLLFIKSQNIKVRVN